MIRAFSYIVSAVLIGLFILFASYGVKVSSSMQQSNPSEAEAIVVLTGGTNRIERGVALLEKKMAPFLYVSGVHSDVSIDQKVPEHLLACCTVIDKATTTRENAFYTEQWVTKNNVPAFILVTSHYHMPRALLEFKNRMKTLNIQVVAVQPDNFSVKDYKTWETLFIEGLKYWVVWVEYRI